MDFNSNIGFLDLTKKIAGAGSGAQNGGAQQAQGTGNNLKNTDIFTAAKNGITAAGNDNKTAATNPNERNAFGDNSGIGDTYSFTTKNSSQTENEHNTMSGKQFSGSNFAQVNNELQEIAEALGCEADESTIKNKLASMGPEQLIKLKGDILDKAEDNKLISMKEIERKFDTKSDNNTEQDEQKKNKLELGSFTGTQV